MNAAVFIQLLRRVYWMGQLLKPLRHKGFTQLSALVADTVSKTTVQRDEPEWLSTLDAYTSCDTGVSWLEFQAVSSGSLHEIAAGLYERHFLRSQQGAHWMSAVVSLVVVGGVVRDPALEDEVAGIWDDILEHMRLVLAGANEHGYDKILELSNPTIEEIVKSINSVDELLNKMFAGPLAELVDIDTELKLNDCQQCIHLIRRVHIALKYGNQDEYNDVIQKIIKHQK